MWKAVVLMELNGERNALTREAVGYLYLCSIALRIDRRDRSDGDVDVEGEFARFLRSLGTNVLASVPRFFSPHASPFCLARTHSSTRIIFPALLESELTGTYRLVIA